MQVPACIFAQLESKKNDKHIFNTRICIAAASCKTSGTIFFY